MGFDASYQDNFLRKKDFTCSHNMHTYQSVFDSEVYLAIILSPERKMHSTLLYIWAWLFQLTTSLVNVSLKFQTLIYFICQYFLLKKCEKLLQCKSFALFSTKNISVFGYKVVKHLTS